MTQLDGKSKDLVNENIEKLKEIFPEVFSEGKIDFSKLEEELGLLKRMKMKDITSLGMENLKQKR